jgi:hypothetical protein
MDIDIDKRKFLFTHKSNRKKKLKNKRGEQSRAANPRLGGGPYFIYEQQKP